MVRYSVEVDMTGCIMRGLCYTTVPKHFESDVDGLSQVVGGEADEQRSVGVFDDDGLDQANYAALACPVSVITVTEL